MKWRKWNNILHRDIGYLIFGLTIVYGISGLAVNHMADWNPNYARTKSFTEIEPILAADRDTIVALARQRLQLTQEPQNSFRPDTETLQLFYEGRTYVIDLPTGNVIIERTRARPVLHEMNQLHINAPKSVWTYVADLYAVSLIVVAVTGLFVLKGRYGIGGRGAWLTAIGAAVPIFYWLYYIYVS